MKIWSIIASTFIAFATLTSSVKADLVNPTYSGSFIVNAAGYICGSGSCVLQQAISNQAITGPGSLSYSAIYLSVLHGGKGCFVLGRDETPPEQEADAIAVRKVPE